MKSVAQQASSAYCGFVRKNCCSSIARIHLGLANPTFIRLPYRIRLKRFGLKYEIPSFADNNPVALLSSIMIVIFSYIGNVFVPEPNFLQFQFRKIARNHAPEAGVLIDRLGKFFGGDIPPIQYGFGHG